MEFVNIANSERIVGLEFDGFNGKIKDLSIKVNPHTRAFYIRPRFFIRVAKLNNKPYEKQLNFMKSIIWDYWIDCRAYFEVISDDSALNQNDYERIKKIIRNLCLSNLEGIVCIGIKSDRYSYANWKSTWNDPREKIYFCDCGYCDPYEKFDSYYEFTFKERYLKDNKAFERKETFNFTFENENSFIDYIVSRDKQWDERAKRLHLENHPAVLFKNISNEFFGENTYQEEKCWKYNIKNMKGSWSYWFGIEICSYENGKYVAEIKIPNERSKRTENILTTKALLKEAIKKYIEKYEKHKAEMARKNEEINAKQNEMQDRINRFRSKK